MDRTTGLIILSGAALAALFFSEKESAGPLPPVAPAGALSPLDFTRAYYPYAKSSEISTGVPALVTMAQAALESGWGKHAPGFNFFGIKPGSAWTGAVQRLKTWECGRTGNAAADNIRDEVIAVYPPSSQNGFTACRNGGKYSYRTWSKFRAYGNAGQSFYDHGKFLRVNDRYAAAFNTTTPENFARVVAAAGYASTTPGYADLVIQIMNRIRGSISQYHLGKTIGAFPVVHTEEIEKSTFPIRIEYR